MSNKCEECNNFFDSDDLGMCNTCEKTICMQCDEGSVKDGWLCGDCPSCEDDDEEIEND